MTHRKDISLDPKATHYCSGCGLTMKARDELMCPVADGDFCVPKRREKSAPRSPAKKPTVVWLVVRLNDDGSDSVRYGGEWESSRKAAAALAKEQTRTMLHGAKCVVRKAVLS